MSHDTEWLKNVVRAARAIVNHYDEFGSEYWDSQIDDLITALGLDEALTFCDRYGHDWGGYTCENCGADWNATPEGKR